VQTGVGLEVAEDLQAAAAGQVEVEHDHGGPGMPAKSSVRRSNRIAVSPSPTACNRRLGW
jgi:hypothetical protein